MIDEKIIMNLSTTTEVIARLGQCSKRDVMGSFEKPQLELHRIKIIQEVDNDNTDEIKDVLRHLD